jgi:hypothetical protein
MENSRAQVGAHQTDDDHSHHDHARRANPLGAYIATVGALVLFLSMFLPWVGIGPKDKQARMVSGYESDSIIPFMGLLAVGFAIALLYALKRADRNQHRGLTLASFAVGLASLLWTLLFFINPIETVKYAGAGGEAHADVSTSWGLWIGLIGALLWTVGSFLLAKEPEGDVEHDAVRRTVTSRAVTHEAPLSAHHAGTDHLTGTDHYSTGTVGEQQYTTGGTGTTGTTGTTTGGTSTGL